jgi:hypothetical protein
MRVGALDNVQRIRGIAASEGLFRRIQNPGHLLDAVFDPAVQLLRNGDRERA